MNALYFLETIVFGYAALFSLYYFIFSLAGLFQKKTDSSVKRKGIGSFAILIPAYKEDSVIIETVTNTLLQKYPASKFKVVVIYEELKKQTITQLHKMPVICVSIKNVKNTKAFALQNGVSSIGNSDYVLVLDADNMLDENCLHHLNATLQKGYVAVQGYRIAKNTNNSLAILDGLSEEINNHIFRRGHRALNFSSALIGSGMAFNASYFRTLMDGINTIWEDRELEMRILLDGNKIEFVEQALIYDEKVDSQTVLMNQRSRWFCGQLIYALKNTMLLPGALLRGNADVVNKIVQGFAPPLSIFIVLLSLLSFFTTLNGNNPRWMFVVMIFLAALLMAIPYRRFKFKILKACIQLPLSLVVLVFAFLGSIFKMQTHYHTPHHHKSVSVKNLVP